MFARTVLNASARMLRGLFCAELKHKRAKLPYPEGVSSLWSGRT